MKKEISGLNWRGNQCRRVLRLFEIAMVYGKDITFLMTTPEGWSKKSALVLDFIIKTKTT
jgi:hypothetical protein